MKLSVVVIVYNIKREAPRTLLSLSASYQRNMDPADYEVIVVENGSSKPLGREAVEKYGPNFQYHFIDRDAAKPSPAAAVNYGLAHARGRIIGVMIDGARICTPGLLENVLLASRVHDRTIVATPGFYLGDCFQRENILRGYNQMIEDELLDSIDWPKDGYRLYDIGWPDESSSFYHELAESNALFLPRTLWDELHGMDEKFDIPGGGLVNLDTLLRACELPDTEYVVMQGEATFHQVHGGVATNTAMVVFEKEFEKYCEQYKALRGKEFVRSARPPRYFGAMPKVCWRHVCAEVNEALIPPSFAAEREIWRGKVTATEKELAEARAERDELRHELERMQQANTWLVPLRSAYRGVSALRSRLARKNGNHEQ